MILYTYIYTSHFDDFVVNVLSIMTHDDLLGSPVEDAFGDSNSVMMRLIMW